MGKHGAREISELAALLGDRVGDLGVRVAEVRDVGAADGIEVALAALVDEPAPVPAHDLGVLVAELAIEDVAARVTVCGHAGKLWRTTEMGEHWALEVLNYRWQADKPCTHKILITHRPEVSRCLRLDVV